jgi:voltage-gated potassium channel
MTDGPTKTQFHGALTRPGEGTEPSRIYHVILALLFLMLLLRPTVGLTVVGVRLSAFLWTAIFVGSLLAVRHRKALFGVGVLLMVPAIVLQVLGPSSTNWELWRAGLAIAAFLFIATVFLLRVLSYPRVTGASVSGSLCVYFILGVVWAIAYGAIERLAPGSFSGLDHGGALSEQFVYFSYVTLTTLGYGDITPVHPVAMTLATVEAVAGQLFLVGLVAYLVGRTVAGAGD